MQRSGFVARRFLRGFQVADLSLFSEHKRLQCVERTRLGTDRLDQVKLLGFQFVNPCPVFSRQPTLYRLILRHCIKFKCCNNFIKSNGVSNQTLVLFSYLIGMARDLTSIITGFATLSAVVFITTTSAMPETVDKAGPSLLFGSFGNEGGDCRTDGITFAENDIQIFIEGEQAELAGPVDFYYFHHEDGFGVTGLWQFQVIGSDGQGGDWFVLISDGRSESVENDLYNDENASVGVQFKGFAFTSPVDVNVESFSTLLNSNDGAFANSYLYRCQGTQATS